MPLFTPAIPRLDQVTDPTSDKTFDLGAHTVEYDNGQTDFEASSTNSSVTFTGSGLSDFTLTGTYLCGDTRNYVVQIDGTGAPDTFELSRDGGITWVDTGESLSSTPFLLECGLTISWAATTGHTIGDKWSWTSSATAPTQIKNAAGTVVASTTQRSIDLYDSAGTKQISLTAPDNPAALEGAGEQGLVVGTPFTGLYDIQANALGTIRAANSISVGINFYSQPQGTWFGSELNLGTNGAATGILRLFGSTSGVVVLRAQAVQGNQGEILLPTSSTKPNSFLQTDAGDLQNTSWEYPAGAAPATSTSTGQAGQIAFDASWFYVCVATNSWKRIALSSF
jgi:hypothetical protein